MGAKLPQSPLCEGFDALHVYGMQGVAEAWFTAKRQ